MKTKSMLCMLLAAMLAALCALPALAAVPDPPDSFYFLDQADVLSEATEGEIFFSNQLLNDACGAQIVVVTVKSTRPDEIDDYAYKLINQWGIGDKDKQNGFLLVLAIDDDNYYAVPGTGLESKLSSGVVSQYFDDYLETDFAAKRYDAGVKRFFEAIFKRVADIYGAKVTTAQGVAAYQDWAKQADPAPMTARSGGAQMTSTRSSEGGGSNSMIFVVTILLIIVVALALSGRRRRTYYGGGWFPFFLGSAMRRRTPPPPPHGGPMPGSGGYRGAPGGSRPSGGSGLGALGGLFRSTGGAGRTSGGTGRTSFGGGGSRSFGSARGGGGGSRGGGAGRGRH